MKTNKCDEVDSGFFARIRKKLFGDAGPVRLKALPDDHPQCEAKAKENGSREGHTAASLSEASEQSQSSGWLRALRQLFTATIVALTLTVVAAAGLGTLFSLVVMYFCQKRTDGQVAVITFKDVGGADEAKSQLKQVVEYLKNPRKFTKRGERLPKGILLVGPPGTGKTLLARAVAGEAGVPFFHADGPELEGYWDREGARLVRELFKKARAHTPCVIFIDQIDSVGRHRTPNVAAHPFANHTVNQLVTEMDGFLRNEGMIVLAATDRLGDLDKAVVRSGRFDLTVRLPAPDLDERKAILELYLRKVKRGEDVDVESLARRTVGLTGADLENLVNQAALRSTKEGAQFVTKDHIEFARDNIFLGVERKCPNANKENLLHTAYHESGHALVAYYTTDADPVDKITIVPRGSALGCTSCIAEVEQKKETMERILAVIDVCMGGRAAEELKFGTKKVASGASSDLERATAMATAMVTRLGMSERFGLRTVDTELSPAMTELKDNEIKSILQDSYNRAKKILEEHQKALKALAEALMTHQTLDADAFKAIIIQTAAEE